MRMPHGFYVILLLLIKQICCIENNSYITDVQDEGTHAKAINNNTIQPRQRGYGLVKFEDQSNSVHFEDESGHHTYGLIDHRPSNTPLRFEEPNPETPEYDNQPDFEVLGNQRPSFQGNQGINSQEFNFQNLNSQPHNGIVFQDDNRLENSQQIQGQKKKKRRRRKRKPKQQFPGQGCRLAARPYDQQGYGLASGEPNQQGYGFAPPGPPLRPGQGSPGRPNSIYHGPVPRGQFYRPPRRRKLSIAEEALTSVTTALTSIAHYDDFQCVPRLLCEVAGGNAPGGGQGSQSGVLQTIINLQPLVTLLAAYNGISTSPLFVFGRAALLGMTSKGNAGTCRYAYPLCPTDPEQLVHYLNNHNGGFFRFFNSPPYQGQQNLEQFYNHLSNIPQGLGQNYGQYPNSQQNFGSPQQQIPGQQNFGYQQNYGFQSQSQVNGLQNPGLYQPNTGFYQPNPGLYPNGYGQSYGNEYPYQQNNRYGFPNQKYKNNDGKEAENNKLEKRIQNRPDVSYVDGYSADAGDDGVKWYFPKEPSYSIDEDGKQRLSRTVKFPGTQYNGYENIPSYADFMKQAKGFNFPDNHGNRQYIDYYNYPFTHIDNSNLKLDENGFYVEDTKSNNNYENDSKNMKEEGVQIVYVLRGNSDPNHPEVVKLRPGQKLQ